MTLRGNLRVYLGAAPGVGKTYAALEEMHRLVELGRDAVVGFVEVHGRRETAALVAGLEVVPRRSVLYRGSVFEEMDLAGVLARSPEVVLVDELAHSNVPGVEYAKRWEDVEVLLAAGIDVISTVNIQHLQSLNDVIEEITGVPQREIIPDEVVRRANEIELVDLTQEQLRSRMTAGKIYPAYKVDAALSNFFRPGNLGALRELALSWTADRVDEAVARYRVEHGIADLWETRERVVVGITGAAGGDLAIRRAARMAMRSRGQLLGVHVRVGDGLADGVADRLPEQVRLLQQLGGGYHEMSGTDVGDALVEFAVSHNATQLVMGATRRSRWQRIIRGAVVEEVIRRAGDIDVHVISDPARGRPRARPHRGAALPRRRRVLGWFVAALGLAATTVIMSAQRDTVSLQNVLLIYLLVAVGAAWVGGFGAAIGAAVIGFLLANYLFTPPFETWSIDSGDDLFALLSFVIVSGAMGALVGATARRAGQVRQARAEVATLVALATAAENEGIEELVTRVQIALDAPGVAVLEETSEGWRVRAAAGDEPPSEPDSAARVVAVGKGVLALNGGPLTSTEERLWRAFSAQIASAMERSRLAEDSAELEILTRADELRTSLLRAVSHDLRSPLAAIKANVTSLLEDDVSWTQEQQREFAEAIYAETNRLDHLVADLLDAGRIQAGAVHAQIVSVGVDEVVAGALIGVRRDAAVSVAVAESLPRVKTDPGLLERVIENLIRNAVHHEPAGSVVVVDAGEIGDRVDVRIVDHGPGIAEEDRIRIFLPFQRLEDVGTSGVGLGLAVAKGLCDAMGHELSIEETQGGGTTMVVSIEKAR